MPIPTGFECYYATDQKNYWIQDIRHNWIDVSTETLRLILKVRGARGPSTKGGISEIDRFITETIGTRNVGYAGPLAGYKSGVVEQQGTRLLVTTSPAIIDPKPGDWPSFKKLLSELFYDSKHPEQLDYFHGWLLYARRCLIASDFKPGQCLVMAGPPDCGKSFFQNRITLLLGGRAAKPYQYMAGETTFNRELFGAEHLMIEDVVASTDIRSRRNFGSRIKEFTVNELQVNHGKCRDGINVLPLWRVTLTVNDEPEDLMVLPPMIDSVADKFILLKVGQGQFPVETEAFRLVIDNELKHYLHWLHNEWVMPDAIRSRRFGIKSFQHPDLLTYINELAPEHELHMLINEHCFKNGQILWKGTAAELQTYLSMTCEKRVERLLKWGQACSTYLSRLSKQFPDRFLSRRSHEHRYWEIKVGDAPATHPPTQCNNEWINNLL